MATTPFAGLPLTPDSVKISQLAAADRAIAETVDGILAGELTDNLIGAATEAAADAVVSELSTADILTGADPRARVFIENTTAGESWAHPFTDGAGGIVGGFTDAGVFRLAQPLDAPINQRMLADEDILTGRDPRAGVYVESGTGWAHPFTDGAGGIVGGFTEAGVFRLAQPLDAPISAASRTQVACLGDSLVRGYTGGTAWDLADAFPAHLSKLLPGVEVVNAGYGGNTVDDLRFRVGAMPVYAEITGGIIPADGPVGAVVRQKLGMVDSRQDVYYGELAGIIGDLTRSTAGTWTFTRREAGSPVPVAGKQRLMRPDLYPRHTSLFWIGRNDVSYGVTGRESDVVEHVTASIVAAVEHLAPQEKQFGVVSILNRVDEPAGTPKYEQIRAINDRLAQLFPGRFLNLRPWLIKQAIYDAGLTPTSADLAAMAADAPPPQIMDGGSHYVRAIAPLLAHKFADYLNEKGYV